MQIALLMPPLGCVTHPYLSLPSLTAFLRSRGHNVFQCDIGIRALDIILTRSHLEFLSNIVREKISAINKLANPTKFDSYHLLNLEIADSFSEETADVIEDAKSILRSPVEFYNPKKYCFASNTIRRGYDVLSAAYFPTIVSYDDIDYKRNFSYASIYNMTGDELHNPFLKVMRETALPQILPKIPPVVGISVTFYPQFFSGYTLARLIKYIYPAAHIVMGGAAITSAEKRIRNLPEAFNYVDSYVFGEGETAFAKLLEIIQSGRTPHNDLNKLFMKDDMERGSPGKLTFENVAERENFDELPAPDYDGLNLEDYLSPENVLSISSSRGCYYGKCAFCSVSLPFRNECRRRSIANLQKDIGSLQQKHNARFFYFADDCITPKRCREIADISISGEKPFYWQSEIRYEKGFTIELLRYLHRGGCRQLIVGNESGNQRVLDSMKKNTLVENNREILRAMSDAGIAVHLQNFIGFPGETEKEAMDTIDFLVSVKDQATSMALATYSLNEYSMTHLDPDSFGISDIKVRIDSELIPFYNFETKPGMNREEVQRVYSAVVNRLMAAYPNINNFLDDSIGAHAILYMVNAGKIRKKEMLPGPPPMHGILSKTPRLKPSVKMTHISKSGTLLFNTETARYAFLDSIKSKWIDLLSGEMSLKESIEELHDSLKKEGAAVTREKLIAIVTYLADDLYSMEFLDLD